MTKKKTAILSIGEICDFDSFLKLHKEKRYIKKSGFEYKTVTYDHILKEKDLDIEADNVIIVPFFPFKYWNKNIENKNYPGLYGNISFRDKFLTFCKMVEGKIDKQLSGKKYSYLNDLKKCAYYRDKKTMLRKLEAGGVNVPRRIDTKSPERIIKEVENGGKFFVKPRCGSMGKGITYLEKDNWQTNFKFWKKRIRNRYSDYGWKFRKVTNNSSFLNDLVKKDFVIEEAIDALRVGKHKVDFRVYVFSGKVPYIYPRVNVSESITTNISQGGKGRPSLMNKLPEAVVGKIIREARKVAKVLDLGFIGVDVIIDRGMKKAYIVDVNMFPGFPKRRTFKIARNLIDVLPRK
ncbi:RimK family alpha-L-glutamate ligase [Candidatus Omnitrophota bacterium]